MTFTPEELELLRSGLWSLIDNASTDEVIQVAEALLAKLDATPA